MAPPIIKSKQVKPMPIFQECNYPELLIQHTADPKVFIVLNVLTKQWIYRSVVYENKEGLISLGRKKMGGTIFRNIQFTAVYYG